MTDRVKGLYVSFDSDIRVDEIDEIVTAIRMIKYVQDVTPSVSNPDDWMNRARIGHEIKKKIYDVLKDI